VFFVGNVIDFIETSENEKFWSAVGYHKPLNFDKNKIYISRNFYEFLQYYKRSGKLNNISINSKILPQLLDLDKSVVIEMTDDQYIPRIKHYNDIK
ncbi:MAG: hypothetical protein Q8797_02240, partial [Candidatus Phytoplasma australasiaticum]|nr:hypothetical protein [Candidatus Phytoplasma australasiaticum]